MVDACEWEQSALLKKYVLERKAHLDQFATCEQSAAGPNSLSPFVPCASSRIPYIIQAARITHDDVLWDLGCGDGFVLFEAMRRCGCRCVGLDIDAPCIDIASKTAEDLHLTGRCHFQQRDLLGLPHDALGDRCKEVAGDPSVVAPTVALVFLTGPGLVRLAPWLYEEWRRGASRGLRLVTCVESLDTAVDYNDPGAMFSEPNVLGWTVCRDHQRWGVFVVPPYGQTVDEWRGAVPRGIVPLQFMRDDAESTRPVIIKGLLTDEEIQLVVTLACDYLKGDAAGQEDTSVGLFDLPDEASFHVAAEDALHSLRHHRVLHLHGIPALAEEVTGLPAIERKFTEAMKTHDEYGLLSGRDVNVRSFEYHSYCDGGSVMDHEHRDDGSLLTMSVLLSDPGDFKGGIFMTFKGEEWVEHHLGKGDAVLFVSEKRHNVSQVFGDRRALIMELWEGPRNKRNRHV